ncbi:MAG: MFS transporter [Undibacterium sp.]|nr:MFS transporter [Opitutaceae bacterium]
MRRLLGSATLDFTPLRVSRDYRLLFIGQLVSAFGYAITYVALPWQVYQLTKSTLLVGLLGLTEFVPMLALAFVGGALADAVDRRRLILWAEAGLALSCSALIANALLPEPRVWVLFCAAALTAGSNALHRPALESLTPQLLPAEHMPAVAALSSFRFSFTFIVGPAIAGVIAETFGAATAYGIDLATYAVSIATLLLIRSIPTTGASPRPSLRSVAEGLRYARSRPELLGTYLIDINAMFFGMPIALFPAIAASFGGASVGLFYSMLAVGPLLVTLTSGWTNRVQRHGLGVTWAVVAWGLAIVGFGLATNLWVALAFLGLAGAADCVSGLFRMTMWNQTIPDRLRGRLAGIEMVSYTSGPYLGNAEAGLVASAFGLRTSVVSGGILCVAGAAVLALLLPKFIHYDAREGLAGKREEEEALKAEEATHANG